MGPNVTDFRKLHFRRRPTVFACLKISSDVVPHHIKPDKFKDSNRYSLDPGYQVLQFIGIDSGML
jgi:hypothetical protein